MAIDIYLIDYFIMAAVIIVSAVMALEAKEIVYAIFFFDLFTIGLGGIFLLFNAGFVAMFQLAVYAGAVAVSVLFAVMLTRREATGKEIISRAKITSRIASAILVIAIASLMIFLISGVNWPTPSGDYPDPVGGGSIFQEIIIKYIVPFLGLGLLIATALVGSVSLLREKKKKAEVIS